MDCCQRSPLPKGKNLCGTAHRSCFLAIPLSAGLGTILVRGTLDTAVSFPWKQLGVISESLSGRTMLAADSEVWE